MTINISSLGLGTGSFNSHDVAIGIPSSGLTISGPTTVVTANPAGFSIWDDWIGNPAPTDTTATNVTISNASLGVIQYSFTTANGSTGPQVGGQVVGYNSTGILVDQIQGYVPGETTFTLNPNYFLVISSQSMDTTNIGPGPTVASLTFGTTGSLPNLAPVPEPSSVALLPLMVVGLMVARIPSVRAFLMGAR